MQAYIVRRLLALVPTLFFASVIVFVTVRLIPGDIIDLMLSQNDIAAAKMGREQLEKALGLDQPMWLQYGRWIGAILFEGNFGKSLWQSTPVAEQLMARLPITFELGAMALIVGLMVAIPIGVYSAVRPLHPYTQALLAAVPIADPELEAERGQQIITGEIPSALRPPPGCRFHTRCPKAMDVCKSVDPPMHDKGGGRAVACHLYD